MERPSRTDTALEIPVSESHAARNLQEKQDGFVRPVARLVITNSNKSIQICSGEPANRSRWSALGDRK